MAQAALPSITSRGYDEGRMHADLVTRLMFMRPAPITGIADEHDLTDRAEHLKAIFATVANYAKCIVQDTIDSMSAGTSCIDQTGIAAILADSASDVCGQLLAARDVILETRDAA